MPLVQAVAEPIAASSTVVEQMHTWRSPKSLPVHRLGGSRILLSARRAQDAKGHTSEKNPRPSGDGNGLPFLSKQHIPTRSARTSRASSDSSQGGGEASPHERRGSQGSEDEPFYTRPAAPQREKLADLLNKLEKARSPATSPPTLTGARSACLEDSSSATLPPPLAQPVAVPLPSQSRARREGVARLYKRATASARPEAEPGNSARREASRLHALYLHEQGRDSETPLVDFSAEATRPPRRPSLALLLNTARELRELHKEVERRQAVPPSSETNVLGTLRATS